MTFMISVDSGLKAMKARNVSWDDILQAVKFFVVDTKATVYDTFRRLADNRGTPAGKEDIQRLISLVGMLFDEAVPFAPQDSKETVDEMIERLSSISKLSVTSLTAAYMKYCSECNLDVDRPNLVAVRHMLIELGHQVL